MQLALHSLFITPLCFFKDELFLVPVMFLLLQRDCYHMPCLPAVAGCSFYLLGAQQHHALMRQCQRLHLKEIGIPQFRLKASSILIYKEGTCLCSSQQRGPTKGSSCFSLFLYSPPGLLFSHSQKRTQAAPCCESSLHKICSMHTLKDVSFLLRHQQSSIYTHFIS